MKGPQNDHPLFSVLSSQLFLCPVANWSRRCKSWGSKSARRSRRKRRKRRKWKRWTKGECVHAVIDRIGRVLKKPPPPHPLTCSLNQRSRRYRLGEMEDRRVGRLLCNMTMGTTANATAEAAAVCNCSMTALHMFRKDFEERLADCGCGGGQARDEEGGLKSRQYDFLSSATLLTNLGLSK